MSFERLVAKHLLEAGRRVRRIELGRVERVFVRADQVPSRRADSVRRAAIALVEPVPCFLQQRSAGGGSIIMLLDYIPMAAKLALLLPRQERAAVAIAAGRVVREDHRRGVVLVVDG